MTTPSNTNQSQSEMKLKTPLGKLKANRAWKLKNRARMLAYFRRRNAEIQNNPILRANKLESNRRSSKRNRAKLTKYDRNRDRIKLNARGVVRNRIWRGILQRKPCEVCGNPKSHAHHENYLKPLEVKWLCAFHHKQLHRTVGA